MTVMDASAWISLLLAQDAHHTATRDWYGRYIQSDGAIVEPVTLLSEVSGALARRTGDLELADDSVAYIRGSQSVRVVILDDDLGVAAARVAADLRLRGADAVYVALALREGVPLVTWDWEQRERAAAIIEARTPT